MAFLSCPSFAAVLLVLAFLLVTVVFADESSSNTNTNDSERLNVYGDALQPCSSDGMALTGYTRSGYCVDRSNDSGSHHICIDLSSLDGGGSNQNFCDVTGQSDWCSAEDMPCHEDPDTSGCSVINWCVCQWAFASYIQGSGGCDNIQTVVCDSINQQALLAYQKTASKWNADPKYQDALDCLMDRCGLDASHLGGVSSLFLFSNAVFRSNNAPGGIVTIAFLVVAAIAAGVGGLVYYRKRVSASKTIRLDHNDGVLLGDTTTTSLDAGSKLL